jgi:hypothetical protein
LSAIGASSVADLIRLADLTSDSPFNVVKSVAEFFTEICRLRGGAQGYALRRKAFDGRETSISNIPLGSSRLALHLRCLVSFSERLLFPAARRREPIQVHEFMTASAGTTGRDLTRVLHRSVTLVEPE